MNITSNFMNILNETINTSYSNQDNIKFVATDNFIKSYENLVKKGFIFSKIRKGRKVGTLVATLNEPPLGIPTILIGQDGGVS